MGKLPKTRRDGDSKAPWAKLSAVLRWCGLRLIPGFLLLAGYARGDGAAFDLTGPRIEMKVTRGGKTLPISEVPNLQEGDRLWLHPELGSNQSVRFLLIAAFLRGSTNPPPEQWFVKAETWNKQMRQEGMEITVPEEAQQVLLFLAPETAGDFGTLRSAVRGKPGAFVRASQDLEQAALDRSRLDAFLAGIKAMSNADPKAIHDRSLILARSLQIKIDAQCFDKPTEEQAPCLMRNPDQTVLDDGHSQSMVGVLTSGPFADLAGAVSTTQVAGGGVYSPYVGIVLDVAHMMEYFHTAEYQYIPALALPRNVELDLKLNSPPSFHKPMSVLVAGLPAVENAQFPPLRAIEPKQNFCLQQAGLVLPVEGAPLVFSTGYAHDVVLHVQTGTGPSIDLPATADASRGGFAIDTRAVHSAKLDAGMTGTLQGRWGFEPFTGPAYQLQIAMPAKWILASGDATALIAGRQDTFHLTAPQAACVDRVTMKDQQGKPLKSTWKLLKPDELEVEVSLNEAAAGTVTALVGQSGLSKPDEVPLRAYSEAARLDRFALNAGDREGILTGTRLDQVAGLELDDIHFVPAGLTRANDLDELHMAAPSGEAAAALKANRKLVAHVALKDGRVLDLETEVEPPRPRVTLLSKSVEFDSSPSVVRLGNPDYLPQKGQISFFLKTDVPKAFPHGEMIEVATDDGSADVLLSLADGTLVLEDPQTVMGSLQPLKSLGLSVFGPLRLRPVAENGDHGDWQPLAKVLRVPSLKEVRCPIDPDKPCSLMGQNLFLIDSVASDPQFTSSMRVPAGFVDSTLSVPRPNGTLLYVKLRDDPTSVNQVALPVLPEP